MNRIFISYRSSDGKKDANRLAEDLNTVFGDDQVFFDKHDLRGGSSWREAIFEAIGNRPVVLVILSPDYFGAHHANGRARLDDADDPVRQELGAAIESGATLLPLLGEGVTMPAADDLPPELRAIKEKHALKLRTDDWRHDLLRVIEDLVRAGVKPVRADWRSLYGGTPAPLVESKPWFTLLALSFGMVVLFEIGVADEPDADTYYGAALLTLIPLAMAWLAWKRLKHVGKAARYGSMAMLVVMAWEMLSFVARGANEPAEPVLAGVPPMAPLTSDVNPSHLLATAPPAAVAPPRAGLSGGWTATLANGQTLRYTLQHNGERVRFDTGRVDVRNDPGFQALNQMLAATQGVVVRDVRIQGEGELHDGEIDAEIIMTTGDGMRTLDAGSMALMLSPDGRMLSGSVHFMSGQPAPIALRR